MLLLQCANLFFQLFTHCLIHFIPCLYIFSQHIFNLFSSDILTYPLLSPYLIALSHADIRNPSPAALLTGPSFATCKILRSDPVTDVFLMLLQVADIIKTDILHHPYCFFLLWWLQQDLCFYHTLKYKKKKVFLIVSCSDLVYTNIQNIDSVKL